MTLHARHGSHGPSELTRLQRENDDLRAEVARLKAVVKTLEDEIDKMLADEPDEHEHEWSRPDWITADWEWCSICKIARRAALKDPKP